MVTISAQVSVYPLRQAKLGPTIDGVLAIFRQHGLNVTPGPMSTLVSGDAEAVFVAIQEAFCTAASDGEFVMVATFSNACSLPTDFLEGALAAVDEKY